MHAMISKIKIGMCRCYGGNRSDSQNHDATFQLHTQAERIFSTIAPTTFVKCYKVLEEFNHDSFTVKPLLL